MHLLCKTDFLAALNPVISPYRYFSIDEKVVISVSYLQNSKNCVILNKSAIF
jgi:hypothetical protein